jgi:hypothetical protein
VITLRVDVAVVCPDCDESVALGVATPEIVCTACRSPVPLGADAWKSLLTEVSEAATTLLDLETRDVSDDSSALKANVRLAPPLCGACRSPFPLERVVALADGSPLFCGSCGHPSTRRAMPDLAADVSLFGEDRAATSFCALVDRPPSNRKLVTWKRVREVAVDDAGNSYFSGLLAIEGAPGDDLEVAEAAWSIDANLQLRWLHRFEPYDLEAVENVALVDDRAFVSGSGATAFVARDDGRTLPVPWQRPFDTGFRALHRDRDGSWLVSFSNVPFVRMTTTGEALPLYPDKAVGFLANLRDAIRSDPFAGVDDGAPTALLPDGSLAALTRAHDPDRVELVRADRRGEVVSRTVVPIDARSLGNQHLEVDHAGRVLFLDGWQKRLFVIMPTPSLLLQEAIVGAYSHLAILPDDTFWIFGDGGAAHHFGRDGRLLFAREALITTERDEIEQAIEPSPPDRRHS